MESNAASFYANSSRVASPATGDFWLFNTFCLYGETGLNTIYSSPTMDIMADS